MTKAPNGARLNFIVCVLFVKLGDYNFDWFPCRKPLSCISPSNERIRLNFGWGLVCLCMCVCYENETNARRQCKIVAVVSFRICNADNH